MSTVNGFQVGSETLRYNYESLDNYNTPNFSTSSNKTYAVGDYVMYNGKLYKCTTATTGGTWVSGSWTLAVLSDDVGDLNRQLNDVEGASNVNLFDDRQLIGKEGITYVNGEFVGTALAFTMATSTLLSQGVFLNTLRYTLSFDAYTEANAGESTNGLKFGFQYTTGATTLATLLNNNTTYTHATITSSTGFVFTVKGLEFSYGNYATNIWHVKNIMLVRGATEANYVPYLTAKDTNARTLTQHLKSVYSKAFMANGKMKLSAHAGYTSYINVDNSIPAYEDAGKYKMWGCEGDARRTSDGYYVMIHDESVNSATDGTGNVSEMTLAQLRQLHLLDVNGQVSNEKIPTFEEYLCICKKYGMVAIVEVKSGITTELIEVIEKYGMQGNAAFIVSATMANYYPLSKNIVPQIILSSESEWSLVSPFIDEADNYMFTCDASDVFSDAHIQYCHSKGIPVGVYVVNVKADADAYYQKGIDFITTAGLVASDWQE